MSGWSTSLPEPERHSLAGQFNPQTISGADYVDLLHARARYCAEADAITPATKWLIFSSPSNPTGATYSASEIAM